MPIDHGQPLIVLGALVAVSIAARALLSRAGVPAVVGYLLIGLALRVGVDATGDASALRPSVELLAEFGIALLLFRVGLDVNPYKLLKEIPRAAWAWAGNVGLSFGLGVWGAYGWIGTPLVPSLFVGVALSATSVAVSLTVWEDHRLTDTSLGRELLVIAELDDVSAILLMAILLAIAPVLLVGGSAGEITAAVLSTGGLLLLKALIFGGGCVLFSRFVEPRIAAWLSRMEGAPDRMVSIAGMALMIAGFADLLGFSAAIGALFAGLVFSRDPDAVRGESYLDPLLSLFSPFFFISIGFGLEMGVLASSLQVGLLLFVLGLIGKLVGAGAIVALQTSPRAGVLLGLSMVPRAEIATVVVFAGLRMGPDYVPPYLFGAVVVVCALSCLFTPLLLNRWLPRWRDSLGA